MSSAAKCVRISVRLAYFFAAVCVVAAIALAVASPQPVPIFTCVVTALCELAAAWAIPKGLEKFGEDHWPYNWRSFRAKLLRRA